MLIKKHTDHENLNCALIDIIAARNVRAIFDDSSPEGFLYSGSVFELFFLFPMHLSDIYKLEGR